jgi:hypothetical protein
MRRINRGKKTRQRLRDEVIARSALNQSIPSQYLNDWIILKSRARLVNTRDGKENY